MIRRLFKITAYLVLAGIVLVTVFLAHAHWQVRQIQTPMPTERTLRVVLDRTDTPVRIRVANTASQNIPGTGTIAYPAFLVEWSDGRILLIDVGMEPAGAIKFGHLMERLTDADPIVTNGSVFEQMGRETSHVEGIAFTHLHEDHVSGLNAICAGVNQAVPIFQIPQQEDLQNHTTDLGHELISSTDCVRRTRLSGTGPLYHIPGFPGVVAFAAGGHTPGSTIFFVNIDDTIWVFSGDTTNNKRSIDENLPKPTLYSLLIAPEATGRLEELRIWLATLDATPGMSVVVSHDLAALESLPIPFLLSKSNE